MMQKKLQNKMVLLCLIRKRLKKGQDVESLLIKNTRGLTFPPTKFRHGEDLYAALARPLEEDLQLPIGSYYPEEALPMILNEKQGPTYPSLTKRWYIYPVDISLTEHVWKTLERISDKIRWKTVDQIL